MTEQKEKIFLYDSCKGIVSCAKQINKKSPESLSGPSGRSILKSDLWDLLFFHHITDPTLNSTPACSVQQPAVLPFQIGICFSQFTCAVAYSAAAGCGKRDERLARQVVALNECVNDSRSLVPPDRIADENDIMGGDIRFRVFQCRTCLWRKNTRLTACFQSTYYCLLWHIPL